MRSRRAVAVAVLALGACSSHDAPGSAETATRADADVVAGGVVSGTAPAPTRPPSTLPPSTLPPSTLPSTTGEPTATPTTAVVDTGEPFGDGWGLPAVVQLTPIAGGGPRPLLEWEPVAGAAGYVVWVYDPDGATYWTWMGPDTATHLGGAVQLAEDRPGPRIVDGMSWVVGAVDDDLEFLAVSERRWIGA